MEPVIKWPRQGQTVPFPRHSTILIASGRVDPEIIGVFGQVESTSADSDLVIEGTPIAFYLGLRKKRDDEVFYRWQIYFQLPPGPGRYRLTVTGLTKDGEPKVATADFKTEGFAITILSHNTGDDITAEEDDFVAYGSLIDYPLGDVTMTDSHASVTHMSHPFSDPIDLQFWSAQFPPLPPEIYILRAEDSATSASVVTGLHVDN